MGTLFDLLEYNFQPDEKAIKTFSNTAIESLKVVPPLLDDWQYKALRDNDTTGYLRNPVSDSVNTIISISSTLAEDSNGVVGLEGVLSISGSLKEEAEEFFKHTQRLSGLNEIQPDTAQLPHYDLAIGIGKSVTYLVYQSDGKDNNETIMGNFTSILIDEQLQSNVTNITPYANLVSESIVCEIVDPEDPEPEEVCETTLSESQVTEIFDNLTSIYNLMRTRREHDENFFAKSKSLLDSYQKQKRFKNFGQTESNLLNNYIGTPKLLNNINKN
jgi:hypothetical protein